MRTGHSQGIEQRQADEGVLGPLGAGGDDVPGLAVLVERQPRAHGPDGEEGLLLGERLPRPRRRLHVRADAAPSWIREVRALEDVLVAIVGAVAAGGRQELRERHLARRPAARVVEEPAGRRAAVLERQQLRPARHRAQVLRRPARRAGHDLGVRRAALHEQRPFACERHAGRVEA